MLAGDEAFVAEADAARRTRAGRTVECLLARLGGALAAAHSTFQSGSSSIIGRRAASPSAGRDEGALPAPPLRATELGRPWAPRRGLCDGRKVGDAREHGMALHGHQDLGDP